MEKPEYYYSFTTPTGVKKMQVPLSTALILQQADAHGVKWSILPETRIFKLEYNGKVRHFRYQISPETSYVGFHACLDKGETNNLLSQAGVSTAKGFKIYPDESKEEWLAAFNALQKPLVVKPSHGSRGSSISVGVKTEADFLAAVDKAMAFSNMDDSGVIVEQQFIGKEYRVLTSREKVLAILHRVPANVVGDGKSTINELLDKKNADPRRGKTLDFALFVIEKDEDLLKNLKEQGLTLESVPAEGVKVPVRKVSNIMVGGDSIDYTDIAHPSVKEIAVRAVNAIPELDFAGVDFMTADITKPQDPNSYIIIEVNSSPGLCIHEFPYEGQARHTDAEFLYIMFPELKK